MLKVKVSLKLKSDSNFSIFSLLTLQRIIVGSSRIKYFFEIRSVIRLARNNGVTWVETSPFDHGVQFELK